MSVPEQNPFFDKGWAVKNRQREMAPEFTAVQNNFHPMLFHSATP